MISYIKGKLVAVEEDCIVIDNNGIGYNIFVPSSVIRDLPETGDEVKIYTYFLVKEDAMNLYGFLSRQDLKLFKMLISVNGIGPKGAVAILSTMSADMLIMYILSDDAKAISKAPGIGSKTAQRVIIDLKDKIKNEDIVSSPSLKEDLVLESADSLNEAVLALVSLGYSQSEARMAVKGISAELSVEEVLKLALKNLI